MTNSEQLKKKALRALRRAVKAEQEGWDATCNLDHILRPGSEVPEHRELRDGIQPYLVKLATSYEDVNQIPLTALEECQTIAAQLAEQDNLDGNAWVKLSREEKVKIVKSYLDRFPGLPLAEDICFDCILGGTDSWFRENGYDEPLKEAIRQAVDFILAEAGNVHAGGETGPCGRVN